MLEGKSNKMERTVVSQANATKLKNSKKGRIIIRNLSFKATEEAVKNWFLKYGEIDDVKLLRKPNGTLVGCGFVQYKKVPCAAKAIKECNAKPFLGRQIAIDWAIPKQQYAPSTKPGEAQDIDKQTLAADTQADQQNPKKSVQEEDDEIEENVEDEEDNEDEENEEDDAESDFEDDSEGEGDETSKKKVQSHWKSGSFETGKKSDVGEGKTIFVRNLDFSTTQDSLKNFMEQFGDVQYALICMDKVMDRPKGTAFVKFRDSESAQKCLEEFKGSSVQLDGRTLDINLAVTREDLDQKRQEKEKKEHKDNRNLFLAREGLIRPGTLACQGVSQTDMAKRQQNELWKKQMLRNLHMFISRERLCIHNLPPKMTDQQLTKLFLKHSSKTAKIKEARIMRDLKTVGEGNIHPSKGFGFVTFTQHEDALLALRNLNNNPDIFTKEKRPIVEFSVENRAAVKAKVQRAKKSLENLKKGKNDKPSAQNPGKLDVTVPEFSGTLADPKIKGLPSHRGPKVRHRKRQNPVAAEVASTNKPKIRRKMFKNQENRKAPSKKKVPEGSVTKKSNTIKKKDVKSNKVKVPKAKSGKKGKWFDS